MEDATYLKIGNRFYKHNTEFSKTEDGVSVRVEFDRWAEFHKNDLSLFGITPMRDTPAPHMTFKTKIEIYDQELVVVLPEAFNEMVGRQVQITAKVID